MSVSPLSFFWMLRQLGWEVTPGVAEKWGVSQGKWGSKWEAPYPQVTPGENWSLVLLVASGTRCGTQPSIAHPREEGCFPLPALVISWDCSLEHLLMALWACPPRQSPWEECRLFWKDTTLCARTSTEQSRWAPVGRDCQVLLYSSFSLD